ncbi:MAG: diguanylate cyclase [Chloroflexota bacterium]
MTVNALAIADLEADLIYVNQAYLKMWGYSEAEKEQVIGKSLSDFWQIKGKAVDILQALHKSGHWTGTLVAINKDGSPFDVHLSAGIINGKDGMPLGIVGLYSGTAQSQPMALEARTNLGLQIEQLTSELNRETAERQRAETALRDSENRFRSIVQNAADAIIIFDSQENILFWNQAAEKMFGYSIYETTGRQFASMMAERFHQVYRQETEKVIATGQVSQIGKMVEITGLRRDNSEIPLELSLSSWKTKEGILFTAILRDLTERKRNEQMLQHLATYDSLTNLPNRLLFLDRLSHAVNSAERHSRRMAVIFLDLDGFKTVNDSFGHENGDRVLEETSRRLTGCLRKSDTIGRLGGDEFAILLENVTGLEDTTIVVKKIIRAIQLPYTVSGQQIHLTVSLGISFYPEDGKDPQSLLRAADAAMYIIKEHGKNDYHFYNQSATPE